MRQKQGSLKCLTLATVATVTDDMTWMQMQICCVENQCPFVHILMHLLPFSTFWSITGVTTNSSVCTAFIAHCVILLHMTKTAFQTFWHSLPILALHHVSTQATEACAFIAALWKY